MHSRPASLRQAAGYGVVDLERTLGDDVGVAAEHDVVLAAWGSACW